MLRDEIIMDRNWIVEQTKYNVAQWDKTMEDVDPSVQEWNKKSDKYYQRVCEECNFFDSIKSIEWDRYISKNSKVLDLGCGGGWLSAYLSKFENITSILAVDTSKNYLFNIMPGVIKIINGTSSKILPIEGMFSPLLVENESLDMVVASASIHHADNLELLLVEINSKLKMGGHLMILNETPEKYTRYILRICKSFMKIFINTIKKDYYMISPKISSSGFEYDAYLGDKSYPLWYWEQALENSGFKLLKVQDSNLPTVKNINSVTLKHFICQKI